MKRIKVDLTYTSFFLGSCLATTGYILVGLPLGVEPIEKGIEDTVTRYLPSIGFWWDKGAFLDPTQECFIPNWVGFVGLCGIIATVGVLAFKWQKIWKKKITQLIKTPKVYCVCKECGHGILREKNGDICRTCSWYKLN